jgi:hypothetical protein
MGPLLDQFETLDLSALNRRTDWQRRHDCKFAVPAYKMNELLQLFAGDYLLLENGDNKVAFYETGYMDTEDRNMFYEHQRDRAHRFKIRKRRYNRESNLWLEVKEKLPNGKTMKHRLLNPQPLEEASFIETLSPYRFAELQSTINTSYERITLLHKTLALKVTIDMNFVAANANHELAFPQLLIVEFKSENHEYASAVKTMQQMGMRPLSLSKYCLAVATLHPELKQNAFKPTLLHLNKLNSYGYPEPV